MRWRSETAPGLVTAAVDLRLDNNDGTVEIIVPDWIDGWAEPTNFWWRALDAIDLTAVIVEPGPLDLRTFTANLDVDLPTVSSDDTGTPPTVDGWERYSIRTAGMDLVVHHRLAPEELSVGLVAYDDELAQLERGVVVAMLESIDTALS